VLNQSPKQLEIIKRLNGSVSQGLLSNLTVTNDNGGNMFQSVCTCSNTVIKTLAHFACVYPAFLEARIAAHNQVRAVLAISSKDALSEDWEVLGNTPGCNKLETATGTYRGSAAGSTGL
jgi:hypothetical protein